MARCDAAGVEFEAATPAAKSYARWEEVPISGDRGRRIVHYFLKDAVGGSDLAVVGREKSARHMSYDVTPRFRGLLPVYQSCSTSSGPSAPVRLRSRRDVVDWLSYFVTDGTCNSSPVVARTSDEDDAFLPNDAGSKGVSSGKMHYSSKTFSWVGSAWICRKRKKHYRSFCRNGITISVHDFVVVMGEDHQRLVAYIEDLYEDRGCNMTSVRWFHKVDEVGIPLPLDTDDREVFFTPCLQDLSVECIDGLTAVLSAQHFKRYLTQAKSTTWEPYLCRREIDNDDVKPIEITQVEGYWNQEFLKYMYKTSIKIRLKVSSVNKSDPVELGVTDGGNSGCTLKRKPDLNRSPEEILTYKGNKLRRLDEGLSDTKKGTDSCLAPCLPGKEAFKQKLQQQYCVGSNVEVLSQDSGIRGCWFQCTIIKKHFDKIKVRYQDLLDADGSGSLEEWLPLSRVSVPDSLGIRVRGRSMVRPLPPHALGALPSFTVGSIVDARWHDGWWEGIVIMSESDEQKLCVYFPGENKSATFSCSDLRFSKEWACNRWHPLKGRPELARRLCEPERLGNDHCAEPGRPVLSQQNAPQRLAGCLESNGPSSSFQSEPSVRDLYHVKQTTPKITKSSRHHLGRLKWTSHKKRSRRSPRQDSSHSGGSSSSGTDAEENSPVCFRFSLPNSLTAEHDNCKLAGDPLFTPPLAISNLVVSQ